ncbi:hypothetical protein, conserved [Leishmania tarentolae]|uniref:Uncharacterized protein n=1 Tax=Leishmania tarentolae TaxID=5689 RepID=A0A640KUL3_LEITA|nr:hypothetical protein, conserved [Leishmania tarentolae]
MSAENTFETFCALSALQQRRDGRLVPDETSHSFSYYQWLEVANAKYAESQPPAKKVKKEDGVMDCGSALADGLAQQLTASLQSQTGSAKSPAALRHAAQEAFPMPQASADMPAFLALAEAAIRLTLWTPNDGRLAQLAARLRPNLRTLEERGIICFYYGCFPSLQVLMDLLSWRIIVHRWERLTPEMRQVAVDGVLTLCGYLESVATEALRTAVQELPVSPASSSSEDPIELATLDTLIKHASAAVPFQFSTCRDLVSLYPEPVGLLHVPGAAPAASSETVMRDEQQSQPSNEKRVDDDGEVQVGELLGVACAPTRNVHTSAEEGSPTRCVKAAPVAARSLRPNLNDTRRTREGARPSTDVTQTRQQVPTRTASGYIACMSKYHARYADPAKHASSECPYCTTCHLMEVIFGGNKHNCSWGHWPTPRKIKLHLKQFPKVMKLAQERFAAMQCGVQLAATDDFSL